MNARKAHRPGGLVGALLLIAVRRWPASVRAEQHREWTAELEALREEPRAGVRRFAFALSLAVSPAPADGAVSPGWRGRLPGIGERLRPGLGFAVLSLLVLQVLPMRFAFEPVDGSTAPIPLSWVLTLAIVPAGCHLAGRWSSRPAPAGTVGFAGVVTTGVALGFLIYNTVPVFAITGPTTVPEEFLVASIVFVALMTPLLMGVLRFAVRVPVWASVGLALPALFAVAVLSRSAGTNAGGGPLHDGISYDPFTYVVAARFDTGWLAQGQQTPEESIVMPLVILGALLLGYGFGLAARERARATSLPGTPEGPDQPSDPAPGPAWAPSGAAVVVGLVASAVGLVVWAYATATLAPAVGRLPVPVDLPTMTQLPPEWVDEVRWAAVILAALGARAALTRRRGATLAALVLGAWLVAADAVLTQTSLMDGGTRAMVIAGAFGVAGGVGAWRLAGPPALLSLAETAASRRGLAAVAVAAAAGGPLLLTNAFPLWWTPPPYGAGITAVMGVVPAAFVVLAIFTAAAVRSRPLKPALVGALALLPAAVVAGIGVATTTSGVDEGIRLLVGGLGGGTLAVGVAALALAGQRARRERWPARVMGWLVALALAAVLLAPAALYAAIVPGVLLRTITGADEPYSTVFSFQPGVLLVVLPIAAMFARRLLRDGPPPVTFGRTVSFQV